MKTYLSIVPRSLLLALSLILLALAAMPVSAQSPAGWWKFDEGSGTTAADSSGSGNVGTLQTGAAWATGLVGPYCVSLPGSSTGYVDVPTPVVDTTKSYTVMGWVNFNAVSGYQTFVSMDGTQVSGFFLQLRGDTGKFAFSALAGDTPGTATYAAASTAPVAGQWYHVAGVYDASAQTLSLYVNGALQQTVTYAAAWKATGHTEIGRGKYSGGSVDFVNGKIDDVRLYSAALSAAAISAIAAAPFQTPNPAAWWKFDEGSGTTAADSSGSGNVGTLQTGAAWATGLVGPYCVSLPGSSTGFVDVPAPVVDTTQSYTVMGWVNLNQTSGYQTLVSIDGSNVSGFYLQQRGNTGEFGFVALASDSTSAATTYATASAPPVIGEWYHVAGVYDATAKTLSLYVNGALQQTVSYTTAWKATGHTEVGRGKYSGGPVDFVNGKIDDVRVYNAALPAATINAIAQANLPPPPPPTLQINAGTPLATVSPTFYGMMTEEINHSYDGGVYAELIQNRIFQDSATSPVHWSVVQDNGGAGTIALDTTQPISGTALTTCLNLTVTTAAPGQRVGVANDGYWGIPVQPNTTYTASFYAQAAAGFTGPLTVDIESSDGSTIYAAAQVPALSAGWQQYSVTLATGSVAPAENTRFVISATQPGTVWLNLVSLFPPTFNNRPNGTRIDLMQMMAGLTPSFLRLPGGNYLEGNTIDQRFEWKNTIGPLSQRAGHESPWGYRSSDGMGLLEFLEWCEDLHMQPVLAVYAGYSLQGAHVAPGTALQPYVQDALDEIQYLTGDQTTPWGQQRALDGHPAPFPLTYVEIGNEDFFDSSGSYDGRFSQFYDAIKAAYPNLQLIATTGVTSRVPDVYDDHYYKSASAFESDVHHYDNYSRTGTKIFVGEWASQEGSPTPDLNAALGDAAWLTGLEHDSDVVVLESYAPLLVNVNSGASQWGTNLIGYDALNSYGSPSYYVQAMFSANHGNKILGGAIAGVSQTYYSATQDSAQGTIFLKVVNAAGARQLLHITLNGAANIAPTGTAITLSSGSPSDTNTLANPLAIVPVTAPVTGLSPQFDYTFAPYSVTVLRIPMIQATLSTLTVNPASVLGGTGSTGTVTLSAPAPAGGAVVTLSSSDPSAVVPASVSVSADQTAATFPVTTTAVSSVKTDTLTAAYNGIHQTATLTVNPPAATTTALVSSLNPSVSGQSVTFTATVSGSGSPTGTVQFAIDGRNAGTPVALTGGQSTYTTSALTVGMHSVTAAYGGDAANASSMSSTLTQTVTAAKVSTTLTLTNATGGQGQTVMLTARLRQTVSRSLLSGKTLTFKIDGVTVGTAVTHSSGQATLTYTLPVTETVGSHVLSASFAGDNANNPSSATGTLTVAAAKANTTLTLTNATGGQGQTVMLTARLRQTVSRSLLSGKTLTFKIDGVTVGTAVTHSSGQATLTYTLPVTETVGSHVLSASFAGDNANNPSSATGTLTVQ